MPRRDGPRRHGTRHRQDGAVAVEFGLLVPLIVMLLFGTVTTGISVTHAIGLSNAVREGARFGATNHPGGVEFGTWNATTWDTWASETISRVRGTQFDDGTTSAGSSTAVCVDVVKVGTGPLPNSAKCDQGNGSVSPALAPSDAPSVSTSNVAAGTCVVRVWAARPFEIDLIIYPVKAGNITPESATRFELRETEECK